LAKCAVRPVVVVAVLVLAKHGRGMPLVGDEGAVEEFAADAADEALGDGVGSRCPHWCLDDPNIKGGQHSVERAVNLASRSRMWIRNRCPAWSRSIARLRARWVSQPPVGWVVTPRMCTRRVACSMTKKT
jgi:hypothetical protein